MILKNVVEAILVSYKLSLLSMLAIIPDKKMAICAIIIVASFATSFIGQEGEFNVSLCILLAYIDAWFGSN